MSGNSEPVDWRKLRGFTAVELTSSFVLSWYFESGTLFIDADILLLPDHPHYEKPRPAEQVCIRPVIIEFPFCVDVALDGISGRRDLKKFVGGLGHGAITGMQRRVDGCYQIQGDFGTVSIEAESPVLKLKGP